MCLSKEVGALHVLQRLYVQRNLRLDIFFLTEIAKHKSYKIPISIKHSLYGINHIEIVDLLTFWTIFDIMCFSKEGGALHVLQRLYVQRNSRLEIFFSGRDRKAQILQNPNFRKSHILCCKSLECVCLLTHFEQFSTKRFFQEFIFKTQSESCNIRSHTLEMSVFTPIW